MASLLVSYILGVLDALGSLHLNLCNYSLRLEEMQVSDGVFGGLSIQSPESEAWLGEIREVFPVVDLDLLR